MTHAGYHPRGELRKNVNVHNKDFLFFVLYCIFQLSTNTMIIRLKDMLCRDVELKTIFCTINCNDEER